MKGRQIIRLHSFLRTGIVLRENISIVSTIPGTLKSIKEFDALLLDVLGFMYKQAEPLKHFAEEKKVARKKMIEKAVQLGGMASVYAYEQQNFINIHQLTLSFTKINKSWDNIAHAHCSNIYNLLLELLPNLKDYGIRKKEAEELKVLIENFKSICPAPRVYIKGRSNSTEFLEEKMQATTEMLNKRIDKMMPFFMQYPEFCSAYALSRKQLSFAKAKRELDRKIKKYYTMPKLPKDRRKKANVIKEDLEKELVLLNK